MRLKCCIAAIVIAGLLASCSGENAIGKDDAGTMELSLRMQVQSAGSVSGYEDGSAYENRMDIAGGDFRIYFFTNDPALGGNDRFIARFFPDRFDETSGGTYTTYSISGRAPSTLTAYSDFKVMILANWGEAAYPWPSAGMTVDDVCSHGIFTYEEDFGSGAGESDETVSDEGTESCRLIPFYGIREFTGVSFKAGETTWLDGPVSMLRAMAKIEVVLEDSEIAFGSVALHGVNGRGFCAPAGVYASGDYAVRSDAGWHFLEDGLPLHLVNAGPDGMGVNDEDSVSRILDMRSTLDAAGRTVWYAYVPEYRNFSDGYSYIQVNLPGYEEDLEEYRIYFRTYAENGAAEPGADYDIARNTLYRFTVSMGGFYLNVRTEQWEDSFENDFSFD